MRLTITNKCVIIPIMESLQKRLKEKNIRPSHHRIKILQYLDSHRSHPNVEEIFEDLIKEIPTLSKTTIYNTLEMFLKNDLISGLTISGSERRYDFETKAHSHFYCKECGAVMDIEKIDCPCENREVVLGNKIEEVHLYLKGVCRACLQAGENCLKKAKGVSNG